MARALTGSLGVVALTFILGGAAAAAPASQARGHELPGWSAVTLPGSEEALLRVAGLEPPVEPARLMLEVARAAHGIEPGRDPVVDRAHAQVVSYLIALRQLQNSTAAADPVNQGVALNQPGRASRNQLEAFAAALGLRLVDRGPRLFVEPAAEKGESERRTLLGLTGIDADDIAKRLNANERVRIALPGVSVPLPLPASVWRGRLVPGDTPDGALAAAILADRTAALLYHGFASLDAPTLAFFAGRGAIDAVRGEPAIFAAFGRSVRVRNGRVEVPGGDEAVALWQDLVGERTTDPVRFIRQLLRKDHGWLAFIYDTIAHLEPTQQRFALGLNAGDQAGARAQVRALYAAAIRSDPTWLPRMRPFTRSTSDIVLLLKQIRVSGAGDLAPPGWRRLWEAVFDNTQIPKAPLEVLGDPPQAGAATAALLADRVLVPDPRARQERLEAVLFAQRVFRTATPAQAADILVAVRAFRRYRMSMLALERLGVGDPAIFAAVARSAAAISDISDDDRAEVALAQFQGALAILDRLVTRHSLKPEAALPLVVALANLPLAADGTYEGRVARWIDGALLPAISRDTASTEERAGPEALLLEALAGPIPGDQDAGPSLEIVNWEGDQYRVDYATAELTRLLRVRQRQGGNTLDVGIDLSLAAATLASGKAALADLPAISKRVTEAAASARPVSTASEVRVDEETIRDAADRVVRRLDRARSPRDLADAAEAVRGLLKVADALLADALASIVYAVSLGDPEGLVLLAGNPAETHSFGIRGIVGEARDRAAWLLPVEQAGPDRAWRIQGSLIGLGVALADLALLRVSTEQPLRPPRLSDNERATFAQAVALMDPQQFRDSDRAEILAAIERGRARLESLASDPEAAQAAAAEAGVSAWRRNAAAWNAVYDSAAVVRQFSSSELMWLGQPRIDPQRLDAWGVSAIPLSGRLALEFPGRDAWEDFQGRPAGGLLATRFPDVAITVASELAALELPAVLVPGVLAAAMQDFIDEAQPNHLDDWFALVRQARSISRDRIIDYVAFLTAHGPLVPSAVKAPGGAGWSGWLR